MVSRRIGLAWQGLSADAGDPRSSVVVVFEVTPWTLKQPKFRL